MKRLIIIGITIIALLCGCGQKTEVPEKTIDEEAEEDGYNTPLFLVDGELISYEDTEDGNCVIKLKVWNHALRSKYPDDVKYAEITTTMKEFAPYSRIDPRLEDSREIMPGDYVECYPTDWNYELKGNTLYVKMDDMILWEYAEDAAHIKQDIKALYGYDVDNR